MFAVMTVQLGSYQCCVVNSGPSSTGTCVEFWEQVGEHSWSSRIINADETESELIVHLYQHIHITAIKSYA